MDELVGATMRWDVRRRRWPWRGNVDAIVVGTNGRAMLVRVPLRSHPEVGGKVAVELPRGRGIVEIRHVAPTGDVQGDALVGVEFVSSDPALGQQLSSFALGEDVQRWWWQRES
jgi:hypothetical protein